MDPLRFEEIPPKLILVEGKDDQLVFEKMIRLKNLSGLEIRPVEGKGNFRNIVNKIIKSTGFNRLTHLGIIRDENGDNAGESVQNIFRDMGFEPRPQSPGVLTAGRPRIGYWIVPGCLEQLCLDTIRNCPAMECVNQFFDCLSGKSIRPGNPVKARSLAYLSAQQVTVSTLGLGAQKGYWDLDSPALDGLKNFLEQFQ